jgi:hypothetical protein
VHGANFQSTSQQDILCEKVFSLNSLAEVMHRDTTIAYQGQGDWREAAISPII